MIWNNVPLSTLFVVLNIYIFITEVISSLPLSSIDWHLVKTLFVLTSFWYEIWCIPLNGRDALSTMVQWPRPLAEVLYLFSIAATKSILSSTFMAWRRVLHSCWHLIWDKMYLIYRAVIVFICFFKTSYYAIWKSGIRTDLDFRQGNLISQDICDNEQTKLFLWQARTIWNMGFLPIRYAMFSV